MTITRTGTQVQDGVGRITIDHPPVNILTRDVLRGLRADLETLARYPSLRVLVLDAAGKHFSAGADVGEHLPPQFTQMIPEFIETVAALDHFPAPVIAAVQGKCLGGGFELVLGADIVIAADTASFGQPEILLGVAPPVAAAWLPSRCARGVAADLIFTGDPISADEACREGLVRRVVPAAELEARAFDMASRIARHSAAALRQAKRMLRAGRGEADAARLDAAGRLYLRSLMGTHDAVEGLRAFVDKRPPVWSHQ
jgi:cyclohexa-1,5-dienecarbonyl-CoA hydratase